MGKLIIIIGAMLIVIGLLIIYKIPIPFGNLPGDFVFKGKNLQFYLPITSSIIFSLILSLLVYLFTLKS